MDTVPKSLLDGLKFDIYERVILPDEIEGIRLIESVELTPIIKVTLEDDQVMMTGNLLLKIEYIGDIPFKTLNFEHSIPVEITIPANRVVNPELVDADIENFNVDRLHGRSLNVTGVLKVYEKEPVRVEPLSQERLSEEEVNIIANDYNDLWRHGAISDKDHGQVEDLIVSHLSLLAEVKRLQAVEAEHIALQTIIENARRLAFFRAEEEEPGPRFKMDANGNLERINE